ncbi:MAG: RNA polymerase sigma factor [Myxococcota bacterium]
MDLESLYRENVRFVASVVYRVIGKRGEVEDVVQEVFVDAMEGIHRLEDPAKLRGWLATVAVRKARRRLGWSAARRWVGLEDTDRDPLWTSPDTPPEVHALYGQVMKILSAGPENERLAWSLRYLEELSLEETAAALGCSLATAKRRIARARERLKEVFDEQ